MSGEAKASTSKENEFSNYMTEVCFITFCSVFVSLLETILQWLSALQYFEIRSSAKSNRLKWIYFLYFLTTIYLITKVVIDYK